jgi:hypothetical protein
MKKLYHIKALKGKQFHNKFSTYIKFPTLRIVKILTGKEQAELLKNTNLSK